MNRLHDLRGRVKAARAALAAHPGAQEALRADWRREAAFLARFGITQAQFCHGVPSAVGSAPEDIREILRSPSDGLGEWQARAAAVLPGTDAGWFAQRPTPRPSRGQGGGYYRMGRTHHLDARSPGPA